MHISSQTKLLLFAAVMVGGTITQPICALQDSIVTLIGNESPPYRASHLPNGGPMVQVVRAAFAEEGVATDLTIAAWTRAYQEVLHGNVDVLLSTAYNEEREKLFHYSEAVSVHRLSFLKYKSLKLSWNTLDDLTPYRFGIVRGVYIAHGLSSFSPKRIIQVQDDHSLVRMIVNSRVDFGPLEENVALSILQEHHPEAAQLMDFAPKPLAVNLSFIVTSRINPRGAQIIETFNRGLQRIRVNGVYSDILRRHNMENVMIANGNSN